MVWSLRRFPLTKAVPLAISRGTTARVEHLELSFSSEGITGRGEAGGWTRGIAATPSMGLKSSCTLSFQRLRRLIP